MDTLVSAEWLHQHLKDPDLVLLDCTVVTLPEEDGGLHNVSGRPDYELGHIPNAGFADLKGELSDLNNPVEFSVPTPEQFCTALGALGVGDDSRVVLYDANYSAWAARVWWMLRWVGFDRAALLNGGMAAWTSAGYSLSIDPVTRPAQQLTPHVRPELIVERDEVLASINTDTVHLIDTMPPEFYRGEATLYARAGHIPGATNSNGLDLLDSKGRLRPDDELAALVDGDRNARNITYCGGGIVASLNAFAMTRLGFSDVAVYTASLQEWAADPANPMVVETP
jgi:thiosulfate/3-mercaptopyruvate sulfurtransferase